MPLFYTFYCIVNNWTIQPSAGCDLIILLPDDLSLLGEVTPLVDWSDVLNFDQAGLNHRKIEDNIFFALHNSSRPTQPHSVITNYDNDHFVDHRLDFKLLFVHLEMSLLDSTQGLKRVNSRQYNTELIALTLRRYRSLLKYNHLCS